MTDIIDSEVGIRPGDELDGLRRARPNAREQSQAAYDALFPPETSDGFALADRLAVADFTVRLFGVPVETYAARLATKDAALGAAVAEAASGALALGPFGHFPPSELSAEDTDGLRWTPSGEDALTIGARLAAGLAHAHLLALRPRESSREALEALIAAGWSVDEIVTLSQLVTFVSYQVRVIHALRVLGGRAGAVDAGGRATIAPAPGAAAREVTAPEVPMAFTQDQLWWEPWLPPIEQDALTPEQLHGMVEAPRAALPYFRLLARDPGILRARTLADLDIFTNDDGGLPRAERELAAAVASRLNGCLFCASVHARVSTKFSGRRDDVQRLLDDGIGARIDDRWDALIAGAAALTATPVAFASRDVERLRELGLGEQAIFDLASAAAFFNWANRLMLSLGEPRVDAAKLAVIRDYEASKRG